MLSERYSLPCGGILEGVTCLYWGDVETFDHCHSGGIAEVSYVTATVLKEGAVYLPDLCSVNEKIDYK